MSSINSSYEKGSPLDLVSKKLAELKKENVRDIAAIVTYEDLFSKLDNNLDVNLSDLLKLKELGSTKFNTGIKKLKDECMDDAKAKGHEIDENGLYCKKCKINVCDATSVECPINTLSIPSSSQPSMSKANPWADFDIGPYKLPEATLFTQGQLATASHPSSSAAVLNIRPYKLPEATAPLPSLTRHNTYFSHHKKGGRRTLRKKSTLRKQRKRRNKRTLHKRH
jgi:hypothetical protein